ncbi:MAG: glutathione peroxidase [Ignavibacteriaceae bacterium]|nr:glutathione peroxidase [Ignavibacteriaceae bacterium]
MVKHLKLFSGILSLFSLISCSKPVARPEGAESKSSIYELSYTDMDGKVVNLSDFRGKKILIVNTASKCGYTPQYEGLQKLYEENSGKLVVIGFPANDFMGQEPGTNEEIEEFCQTNYNITFPMSEKISVKDPNMHPVYKWLTDKTKNGWNTEEPKWNFHKYLINEQGELIKVFPSGVKPLDQELTSAL